MAVTYEIYSAKSGRCFGYLTEDQSLSAEMMQRSGYIVIQQEDI